jgi:hypothetical protein
MESSPLPVIVRPAEEYFTYMEIDWFDWLIIILRLAHEFFTYMETSQLPVKGQIQAYARNSGSLPAVTRASVFRSHPKDRPTQSPLTTHKGDVEDLF